MSSSTGLPLSIRETPQSVSVISRQRMDDQNIRTFKDAMENATGITSQSWDNDRVEFMSRGFKLTEFRYDGVPVDVDGAGDHGRRLSTWPSMTGWKSPRAPAVCCRARAVPARPSISSASG
jgi:outer membrane receptor for ferric coprogen and ferric-rhodotorulic acid